MGRRIGNESKLFKNRNKGDGFFFVLLHFIENNILYQMM